MAVGAPGAGEVGVELEAVADVAHHEERRRRVVGVEQEDVVFGLPARVLHHDVPAARRGPAAERRVIDRGRDADSLV